jgi:hypothetical protein
MKNVIWVVVILATGFLVASQIGRSGDPECRQGVVTTHTANGGTIMTSSDCLP